MFATGSIVGPPVIVIVNVCGVALQPAELAFTVIVPEIGPPPEFVPVKLGTSPVPLAAKPIAVFELVHEGVAVGVTDIGTEETVVL